MGQARSTPNRDDAEGLAIDILGWLIQDPDMMGRFLALSGIEASGIRQAAQEPGFYAGVTGFLMNHEPSLMAYCESAGVKADHVAARHRLLSGPEEHSWT